MFELELRRRERELSVLKRLARLADAEDAPDTLLPRALELATEVIGLEAGGVFLLRDDGTTLDLRAHQGLPEAVAAEHDTVQVGTGVAGRVVESGLPIFLDHASADERVNPSFAEAGFGAFGCGPPTAG